MSTSIYYESNVSPPKLDVLGVYDWPIWQKEPSRFDWTYDEPETCYILEGEVEVQPHDGSPAVLLKRGDLASFPAGFSCTWEVRKAVRKHYKLGA